MVGCFAGFSNVNINQNAYQQQPTNPAIKSNKKIPFLNIDSVTQTYLIMRELFLSLYSESNSTLMCSTRKTNSDYYNICFNKGQFC